MLEWFRRFGGGTNQLIVIDTSPYPDFETASLQNLVLRNKDANAQFNKALTSKLAELCGDLGYSTRFKDEYVEQKNMELQKNGDKPMSIGSTEMGRIIVGSKGLVDGTTLQVPTSGYHTLSETAPLEAVSAFINVLNSLADLDCGKIKY